MAKPLSKTKAIPKRRLTKGQALQKAADRRTRLIALLKEGARKRAAVEK